MSRDLGESHKWLVELAGDKDSGVSHKVAPSWHGMLNAFLLIPSKSLFFVVVVYFMLS